MNLILGECLEKLKDLPDNSIDSIVTDPPYGISFMSKKWDYDVPSVDIWKECLRVLKPGGHLLSFSGSRTYHRMAVRIEDAGFEIRDQIMWIYGSGFPKSHNIGKAVDKLQGNEREVIGDNPNARPNFEGKKQEDTVNGLKGTFRYQPLSKGQSEWEGWGTALKPAHEPIVMARKPFKGSVAENVLEWGTGGINIDESRVGTEHIKSNNYLDGTFDPKGNLNGLSQTGKEYNTVTHEGRWPANIILDEEAGKVLDEQSGVTQYNNKRKEGNYKGGHRKEYVGTDDNHIVNKVDGKFFSDKGGASRFFYCPKASKKDRDEGMDMFEEKMSEIAQINSQTKLQPNGEYVENITLPRKNVHPTVKPTELMLYLIKLVTPIGGTVLDCFMGSGSTGKAAIRGGFDFIGIEREEEYYNISKARIENERN